MDAQGGWRLEGRTAEPFFGDYNPYALTLSGGWLHYGQWHHRGDVYLDGEAFYEKKTAGGGEQGPSTRWCCQVAEDKTTIWANFGKANPNTELAEINVRESVFMPENTGLKYITVDGFHFAALGRELGAARSWSCRWEPSARAWASTGSSRIARSPTPAAWASSSGHAPGVDYTDIDAFGDHIVRNNVIRRCGQAGIAGQKGATRCLIGGNLIEDTNYRKEFGGWETAAIKFHESVDTVIRGNLIRGVYHQKYGAFGIWMDWGNQGTRITGNIIYNTQAATVFLEMDHGPILVDNNVLIGQAVRSNSEGHGVRAQSVRRLRVRLRSRHRAPVAVLPAAHDEESSDARPAPPRTTSGSTTSSFARGWTTSRRPPATPRTTTSSWKGPRRAPSAMNTASSIPTSRD